MNKLNDIKLPLSSFSNQRKYRPNLILGIAETFANDCWSDASRLMHRKATFTNSALNWRDYCLALNRVVHLIRSAKRYFYR